MVNKILFAFIACTSRSSVIAWRSTARRPCSFSNQVSNAVASFPKKCFFSPPSFFDGKIQVSSSISRSSLSLSSQASTAQESLQRDVQFISDAQLEELSSNDYVIIPNFIGADLVRSLNKDVAQLRASGKFNVAKIGQDFTNKLNEDIRVAETCFIGPTKLGDLPNKARSQLYDSLDGLRAALSSNPELASGTSQAPALDKSLSETLYAYYPKGGFYRRHRDSVTGSASVLRAYSLLLYLNEDWKKEDGGELRLHFDGGGDFLPEGEEPKYVDVEPLGGTMVLFRSEKIPHEVLDTRSSRLAVVGWYNRPMTSSDVDAMASDSDKIRLYMLLASAALVTAGVASILF